MLPLLPFTAASAGIGILSNGKKAADFVGKNWKPILGVTAVAVGGYLVYRKFFSEAAAAERKAKLEYDSRYPASTLKNDEAQILADKLFVALNRANDDEDTVFAILQNKSYNDFAKISRAFGTKWWSTATGEKVYSWLPGAKLMTLMDILHNDLNNEELAIIQNLFPDGTKPSKDSLIGRDVVTKVNNTKAYKAEDINGTWYQRELKETYAKNDKIGEVIHVIDDEWQPENRYLVVDRSGLFSFGNVIVKASDVIVY